MLEHGEPHAPDPDDADPLFACVCHLNLCVSNAISADLFQRLSHPPPSPAGLTRGSIIFVVKPGNDGENRETSATLFISLFKSWP
jgi:hypothetical protein